MWGAGSSLHTVGGGAGAFGQPMAPQQQPLVGAAVSTSAPQKHDIFVGNLAFNTTEEQLHQAFSEIGKVINVRLVSDVETGKPRGYVYLGIVRCE
jgi:RNA recognition motif-containing protein